MTTIGNKFAQLGTSIINLVGTRASKNMDNLTSTGEANILEIVENAGISGKGSGHSIGEVVYSAIPISDACFHLLDGGLIYGDGIYNDFVTYMSTLYAADPTANYWTTETDWQSSVTTYGVCGKFVYDSTNNTVRLPKITGIIEGTTDLTALGDLIEAGLPNITGRLTARAQSDSSSGAFYNAGNTGWSRYKYEDGSGHAVDFNASRSNSIYGNSTTVQPQSVKVLYYIVIATSTKTDIQVDIDNVTTQINSMVSKSDLQEVQCVVETYKKGNSWYRMWSDGWCEQGGTTTIDSDTWVTITLLKAYKSTDYCVSGGSKVLDSSCTNNPLSPSFRNYTTTNFNASLHDDTTVNKGTLTWYACGFTR